MSHDIEHHLNRADVVKVQRPAQGGKTNGQRHDRDDTTGGYSPARRESEEELRHDLSHFLIRVGEEASQLRQGSLKHVLSVRVVNEEAQTLKHCAPHGRPGVVKGELLRHLVDEPGGGGGRDELPVEVEELRAASHCSAPHQRAFVNHGGLR